MNGSRLAEQWRRLCLGLALTGWGVQGADRPAWPDYQEVLETIRAQMPAVKTEDLNRAVIEGIRQCLPSQVQWISGADAVGPASNELGLGNTNVLDEYYGYFRIRNVTEDLPLQYRQALDHMNASNRLKGIVIDLRYAKGSDYASAVRVADLFVGEEKALLTVEGTTYRSTGKADFWKQPVVALVNGDTAEAAEALAALLREDNVALLLGNPTAGRARVFKNHSLKNGQQLRLATGTVLLGGDKPLPDQGLKPDILVPVSAEDEKAYYSDAYKVVDKPPALSTTAAGTNANPATLASATNRTPRRINEAELVRRQREGLDFEDEFEPPPPGTSEPAKPAITDPALARAIDLLKGLTVVQKARPRTFNR
jgi:hypothetical protein